MLQKLRAEVVAVRPSISRPGQDRVKLRIGDTDENIVRLWVPHGTWEVDDIVRIKLSPDGERAYRDVGGSNSVIKNPS